MRRVALVGSVIALTVALSLVGHLFRTDAQEASATNGSGFVGSWRVTVTDPTGRSYPVLSSYLGDGTTLHSHNTPMAQPGAPGSPGPLIFPSTGHGVWEETGEETSAVTFDVLTTDELGNYLGWYTISGTQRLGPDGATFTGEYVVTVSDPEGIVVATMPTTAKGTRIGSASPSVASPSPEFPPAG